MYSITGVAKTSTVRSPEVLLKTIGDEFGVNLNIIKNNIIVIFIVLIKIKLFFIFLLYYYIFITFKIIFRKKIDFQFKTV